MDTNILRNKVYVLALEYLSSIPRTELEVTKKILNYLAKSSDSVSLEDRQDIKDYLLNELKSEGLLNDFDYSRTYVSQRVTDLNPKSKPEIKKFLLQKGIPADIIHKALELYDSEKEGKVIKIILGKKNFSDRNKARNYFYRRGFDIQLVNELIN